MFEQILKKLENYCAYQDRSEWEVYQKALELGCLPPSATKAVSILKEAGFVDEARYVQSAVRGKFKHNGWGKIKIKQYLKQKKVPDTLIQNALESEIAHEEYKKMLEKLGQNKWKSLSSEKDAYKKKQKTIRFLVGRGFESSLILAQISKISET